jgi:hypothetical protein
MHPATDAFVFGISYLCGVFADATYEIVSPLLPPPEAAF